MYCTLAPVDIANNRSVRIIIVHFYLVKNKMRQAIIIWVILWTSLVLLVSCTRADNNEFMWDQVYSVYLERSSFIHEVDSWRAEYNAELDKSLGIEIDLLCNARGRTPKQCWLQMLFSTGAEFTPYNWQF